MTEEEDLSRGPHGAYAPQFFFFALPTNVNGGGGK